MGGCWVGDHQIKKIVGHDSCVGHEGFGFVDHADLEQRPPLGGVALGHFKGDIGVARQREAETAIVIRARRHRLGNHVHAHHAHVARDKGVVGRDVGALSHFVADVVTGFEEELTHFDVRWQCPCPQVFDVVEVRVVLENPLDQRF